MTNRERSKRPIKVTSSVYLCVCCPVPGDSPSPLLGLLAQVGQALLAHGAVVRACALQPRARPVRAGHAAGTVRARVRARARGAHVARDVAEVEGGRAGAGGSARHVLRVRNSLVSN